MNSGTWMSRVGTVLIEPRESRNDGIERNRMKSRSSNNLAALPIDSLDTSAFLKKLASMIPASKANDGRR
jgi:hypothetical protein